ncbi:uncharacterized protein LOC127809765 isoform X3 [Diospyros lotus]|uniref:uncharacterized protein LOC127809765 isoform X3 n=1 Tax=Diospyros lotus TaxID=55363 RepID=UPI00225095A1|nr:uncharacterized protein LOC127809765 isoform X3 [Diospyros lotus]
MGNQTKQSIISDLPRLPTFFFHIGPIWLGGRFSSSYNSSKLRFALARVYSIRAFAKQKSSKKLRRQNEAQKDLTSQLNRGSNDDYSGMEDRSSPGIDDFQDSNKESSFEKFDSRSSIYIPSRSAVLQACTVTSSLIAALGVVIRQVSHVASTEGWPIHDCSTEVPFVSFEMWHLQLVTGIVIVVSSCRYLLLKTWPDFAESTEAANRQVLTSLQPLDYTVVAFLPGVSERCIIATFWNQLDKYLAGCCSFRCSALGKRAEVFLCNLGNICWLCIRLCNNFVLESPCANGLPRNKQFGWRACVALHIKIIEIISLRGPL